MKLRTGGTEAVPACFATSPKGNKPRQITDETCFALLSDIKPDAFYGLSPIVPFQL
jgi:hypothetical protein